MYWAAFYEHRLRLGSKAIFHLEGSFSLPKFSRSPTDGSLLPAFCAKVMSAHPFSFFRRRPQLTSRSSFPGIYKREFALLLPRFLS